MPTAPTCRTGNGAVRRDRRQQLEADRLDASPLYAAIVDRLSEAGSFGELHGPRPAPTQRTITKRSQTTAPASTKSSDRAANAARSRPSGGVTFANDLGDEAPEHDRRGHGNRLPDDLRRDDTGVLTVDVPTE